MPALNLLTCQNNCVATHTHNDKTVSMACDKTHLTILLQDALLNVADIHVEVADCCYLHGHGMQDTI